MKTIKQTAEYTILQRGDGRYAVRGRNKRWINGDDKVAILVKEKLLDVPQPKPKAEAAPEAPAEEEATTEDAAQGEGEADGES